MIRLRSYRHELDYAAIGELLVETFLPGDSHPNWPQPRWEYMHFHPAVKEVDLTSFGVAEADGQIVGLVHLEHVPHQVYFQVRPGHESIKPALFAHAEAHFQGLSHSTGRLIRALYIHEHDLDLTELARTRGYQRWDRFAEVNTRFMLDRPISPPPLPAGFHLQSLADACDLSKVNQVLWRGFNHPGPPPDEEIAGREEVMRAAGFRRDLTIVAVAPNGDYVAYCGMWVVQRNRAAYVEPVATDPDYRRLGLGRAVVLESLRRVAEEQAEVAWVGSGLPFYQAIGFQRLFALYPWVKTLDGNGDT